MKNYAKLAYAANGWQLFEFHLCKGIARNLDSVVWNTAAENLVGIALDCCFQRDFIYIFIFLEQSNIERI